MYVVYMVYLTPSVSLFQIGTCTLIFSYVEIWTQKAKHHMPTSVRVKLLDQIIIYPTSGSLKQKIVPLAVMNVKLVIQWHPLNGYLRFTIFSILPLNHLIQSPG